MPSKPPQIIPREALEVTGDVRKLLARVAVAAMHGEIKSNDAVIVVKACEQINDSIYSEIKYAALLAATGAKPAELGEMPLFKKAEHR